MAVGGEKGLRFHGNCLNAMKVHTDKKTKQENIKKKMLSKCSVTEMHQKTRQYTGWERRRSRRCSRNMDESRDSRLVKENRNWQMSQCVFVKCHVLDREEGLKKIKTMEDGNSRNGYHKVKCQVPETEELRGREKGEKINQQHTKGQKKYPHKVSIKLKI